MSLLSGSDSSGQPPAPLPSDLAHRAAVTDLVQAFGLCIDRRDWARYRTLFAETVEVDYRPRKPGIPTGEIPSEQWAVGAAACFEQIPATQHTITVSEVAIDGDEAIVTSNLAARHHDPGCTGDPLFTEFSRYEHRCRLSADGWQLTAVHCEVLFTEGNKAVLYDKMADG